MRVHYIQHVAFEGLGAIQPYLQAQGHDLSVTRLYAGEHLPSVDTFDWLIAMGGPMGIYDYDEYSWLQTEKVFIKQAIDAGKTVLGVCLGAQLIADVMGGSGDKRAVYASKRKEIGWFDIQCSPELQETVLDGVFPQTFEAFHWHGDTFDVPAGVKALGASEACANQGFIYDNRVLGLQFHLETTPESAAALIENCGDELDASLSKQNSYVQLAKEMLADQQRFSRLNQSMVKVLKALGA
ncbi:type 1 glutamine amidotransferase [Ghiorsea bivora]|uniref:type 1 glutamine amidotransferase n=1 Tax=Ghiorsea bivora TaxID=1485545 RepID=UPI00056E4280|nr:type 1 glutamine amidotransferase [Ghiorsea bivora]